MPGKLEILYDVFDSAENLALGAAKRLAEQVESAAAARGVARVAVSGGSTPKRMFDCWPIRRFLLQPYAVGAAGTLLGR
jgi:6-phosphogluconolactonase